MSHAISKIQEAEQKAAQIRENAEQKAKQEKAKSTNEIDQKIESTKDQLQKKQSDEIAAHKQICAKKMQEAESSKNTKISSLQEKWKQNTQKATEFLVSAFQKQFS